MLTVLFTIALCRRDASSFTVPSRLGFVVRTHSDQLLLSSHSSLGTRHGRRESFRERTSLDE